MSRNEPSYMDSIGITNIAEILLEDAKSLLSNLNVCPSPDVFWNCTTAARSYCSIEMARYSRPQSMTSFLILLCANKYILCKLRIHCAVGLARTSLVCNFPTSLALAHDLLHHHDLELTQQPQGAHSIIPKFAEEFWKY